MRQLLLRVPDSVHAKIAARAQREGRSINAVATEILDAVAGADPGDRRARLRARAASLGLLPPSGSTQPAPSRAEALAAAAGIGPVLDRILAEDREVLASGAPPAKPRSVNSGETSKTSAGGSPAAEGAVADSRSATQKPSSTSTLTARSKAGSGGATAGSGGATAKP
ncbi:MAG: toxin-antitoxin system HicB family antitoxin [Acidimicrobiales bacterium]